VLITVSRTNANTGDVFVNYAATAPPWPVWIMCRPSGLLTFSNGIAFQTFFLHHQQPVGARRPVLLQPVKPDVPSPVDPAGTATVTITDDVVGLSFSAPAYSINENGGAATITVVRSGYVSNLLSVTY
jgi:hypothetical protein